MAQAEIKEPASDQLNRLRMALLETEEAWTGVVQGALSLTPGRPADLLDLVAFLRSKLEGCDPAYLGRMKRMIEFIEAKVPEARKRAAEYLPELMEELQAIEAAYEEALTALDQRKKALEEARRQVREALEPDEALIVGAYQIRRVSGTPKITVQEPDRLPLEYLSELPDLEKIKDYYQRTGRRLVGTEVTTGADTLEVINVEKL